jgi:hypothetical protein
MQYTSKEFESVSESTAKLISDVDLMTLIVQHDGDQDDETRVKAFECASELSRAAMDLFSYRSQDRGSAFRVKRGRANFSLTGAAKTSRLVVSAVVLLACNRDAPARRDDSIASSRTPLSRLGERERGSCPFAYSRNATG